MRSRVVIREDGPVIVVRGRRVGQMLNELGFRPTFSASAGGFLLDHRRLADLAAHLEYRNVPFRVERAIAPVVGVDQKTVVRDARVIRGEAHASPDPTTPAPSRPEPVDLLDLLDEGGAP